MNELSSTEFRKTFAKLKEQTLVTVNGHAIGTWSPSKPVVESEWSRQFREVDWDALSKSEVAQIAKRMGVIPASRPSTQAQRDELLRKINRGK